MGAAKDEGMTVTGCEAISDPDMAPQQLKDLVQEAREQQVSE
jgi:hypothetical protein